MWTLEIVFKPQKTSAEGHSKTLSQSNLVFINPGIYIYIKCFENILCRVLPSKKVINMTQHMENKTVICPAKILSLLQKTLSGQLMKSFVIKTKYRKEKYCLILQMVMNLY